MERHQSEKYFKICSPFSVAGSIFDKRCDDAQLMRKCSKSISHVITVKSQQSLT